MKAISKNIKKDLWDYTKVATSFIPTAGGPINECINLYQEHKAKETFNILIKEVEEGNLQNIDTHQFFPKFYRLLEASKKGVAKNNLKLIAKLIVSKTKEEQEELLKEDDNEFNNFISILEDLTHDEISVIVRIYKLCHNEYKIKVNNYNKPNIFLGFNFDQFLKEKGKPPIKKNKPVLQYDHIILFPHKLSYEKLNEDEILVILSALQRTGLVIKRHYNDGNQIYTSNKLEKLFNLINFENFKF